MRGFVARWISVLALALTPRIDAAPPADLAGIQTRAGEIEKMLSSQPYCFAPPVGDRAAWDAFAKKVDARRVVAEAEKVLKDPIKPWNDDLYLEFSKNGNRSRWQSLDSARRSAFLRLFFGECIENKGRFIPRIEEYIKSFAAQPTWVMAAHDGGLKNFRGEAIDIDLGSSALGWLLGSVDCVLQDRLPAATRTLLQNEVRKRVVQPFLDMVRGSRGANWWLRGGNNWNSVCLAGCTGAALTLPGLLIDKALAIAAAERYSRYFLGGFTPDGYCSEGIGYWNYGFGHYLYLSDMIREATGNRVDLLARPEARNPARYGVVIEILNGIYPSFSDCTVGARPDSDILFALNRRFQWGLSFPTPRVGGSGFDDLYYGFDRMDPESKADPLTDARSLRSWFATAGILVCRPESNSTSRLAVAMKGGHNNEHHNHNDVGSYIVVVGDRDVLVDPGAEVYTARTFSSKRYESKVLGSFGHPVPRVAGREQRTGETARGRVVKSQLHKMRDQLQIDIKSAYDVPSLKSLVRSFTYWREEAGSFTVRDDFEFDSPQAFETAAVTFGKWSQTGPDQIRVSDGAATVDITVRASGAWAVVPEVLKEDLTSRRGEPTRLGITLKDPSAGGFIELRIVPADGTATPAAPAQ